MNKVANYTWREKTKGSSRLVEMLLFPLKAVLYQNILCLHQSGPVTDNLIFSFDGQVHHSGS
eukprot:m.2405 g.2405  ORF g.2405 m.2405 type:complete len:62 (+) comp1777_c0_seq1:142-327(+)